MYFNKSGAILYMRDSPRELHDLLIKRLDCGGVCAQAAVFAPRVIRLVALLYHCVEIGHNKGSERSCRCTDCCCWTDWCCCRSWGCRPGCR